MKKLIDEIHAKSTCLKSEYARQRAGLKQHNKELIKIKAEALRGAVDRLIMEAGK